MFFVVRNTSLSKVFLPPLLNKLLGNGIHYYNKDVIAANERRLNNND